MFFYLNFLGMYEGGLAFIFIDLTRTTRECVCVNGKTESPKMSTAFLFGLSSKVVVLSLAASARQIQRCRILL